MRPRVRRAAATDLIMGLDRLGSKLHATPSCLLFVDIGNIVMIEHVERSTKL